jgi:hypothetical protein
MNNTYIMTCNCYEPPIRENVSVKADTLDEAWDKAKQKFARKYKVKQSDVGITATQRA